MILQKRLGSIILKCSPKRIKFDSEKMTEIKAAITKEDVRSLIANHTITKKPIDVHSRVRARKRLDQRRKGRQKGAGSRKGKKTARLPRKKAWQNRIRRQRNLIKKLRTEGKLQKKAFRELYLKAKGGYFRSERHMKLYIEEHKLQ